MTDHPYAAPSAELIESEQPSGRIYSPMQVVGGAFVGGPVGVVYFLWANFVTLRNHAAAIRTLWLGALGVALMFVLAIVLPEGVSNIPFSIAYLLVARIVAGKFQLSKQTIATSSQLVFHSNWRVFFLGLLCLLGSLAILICMVIVGSMLGLVDQ